ncbi:MAG TPA: AmpG family muropeptide MFS transporter, partial [Bdellovibrionales bacterium]|nr:AmpG family muropeptide MFS transporter [Bdellovibrionales bacterium]
MTKILKVLRDPKLLIVLLQGFASGLPLLLVGGTLKAWMFESQIDMKTIGAFALVTLPYTWKFVWSPIMDRYTPPLGRRRGWLLISQIGLVIGLLGLSLVNPGTDLKLLAICAIVVAFFSASQDIVVDAYRREILSDEELGLGSSLYVLGYRIALLLAGGGALVFADHVPWPTVYQIMAGVMLLCLLVTVFSPEARVDAAPPRTLQETVVGPMRDFFTRDGAWLVLIFILLFKLGESMASDLMSPYFLALGFTKTEIASVVKFFGFWATIVGSIAGGIAIVKLGVYRSLWIFGIAQAASTLLFSALAGIGNDITWLSVAVGVDNFTGGMATSAFVAFMALQTNKRFTATQYALLSSLMGVPRALFGSTSGILQV